jgi:hypothetical protein
LPNFNVGVFRDQITQPAPFAFCFLLSLFQFLPFIQMAEGIARTVQFLPSATRPARIIFPLPFCHPPFSLARAMALPVSFFILRFAFRLRPAKNGVFRTLEI